MDWNIRIGKQGYVFILTDFKKRCFDVSFLTSINQCVTSYFETEKSWIFLNKLVSRTFFYYGGQFCAWLVSLDCRLRLFEYFAGSFSKNETALSFFFLLLVPVQCLDMTFCTFSFALSRWRQPIFSREYFLYPFKRDMVNFSDVNASWEYYVKNVMCSICLVKLSGMT